MPESFYPGSYSSDYERSGKHLHTGSSQDLTTQEKISDKSVPLTTRESVELFQNAVDSARDEYHKTMNGEPGGEALKPNLTVDLRRKKLSQIPKEVIAIIRQDVERLQLAYNGLSHITYEFTQCSALKYLNLRDNRFKEIPKAIFGLPQLEILDFSRNKLTEVPDEIDHMKALRVFSVQNNNIHDLPYCLGSINTLRMLKVMGNPLNPTLQRIVDGSDISPSPSPILMKDENERDTILTKKLTEFMRNHAALRDSGEDSTSDGPLETPRALSRFPVQPQYSHSTSGSESASDLRSPIFSRPSLPARSHTRVPSSQYGALQSAGPRRPGLAPLALGNERNRSNSESVLQSTQNNKVKRMGLVTKKHNDLGVLDETRTNRNSFHLRGQSHGSALRNGVLAGDSSPSAGSSVGELQRGMAGRRLASLPAQRQDVLPADNLIESSKGVLYALNMVISLTSALAVVIKDGRTKRSSVQRDFSSAAMHIQQLDQGLLRLGGPSGQQPELRAEPRKAMVQTTRECVAVHQRVTTLLARTSNHFANDADPKYFRTLMLIAYGSMAEMSNASNSDLVDYSTIMPQRNYNQRVSTVSTISESSNEGDNTYISDRSVTPTQRRKPARRWKNGSITQQSIVYPGLPTPGAQTAIPIYSNGRSRSNSRATPFYSSTSSSVINTPRSGESFSSVGFIARSRNGSVTVPPEQLRTENQEIAQFERIFIILGKSVDEGLAVIPHLQSDFLQAFENANKQYTNPRLRDQWSVLVEKTTHCLNMTEDLRMSLSTVRLNDREARHVRAFWQLAKAFLDSYGNLLLTIKEAIKHDLINPNMRHQLRPVHTSTREAARLIATSPWNRLTFDIDPQATPQAPTQLQIQHPAQNGYHHRTHGSGGSGAGGSSPYTNVPATPLSAALGPAAQATVPATMTNPQTSSVPPPTPASTTMPPTPGTASLERSFEGDIFQRADTYQSLQQTMIPRRQVH